MYEVHKQQKNSTLTHDLQWPSQKGNPFISYKHSKKPACFKPNLHKDPWLYQGQIQDLEPLQQPDPNSQDLII